MEQYITNTHLHIFSLFLHSYHFTYKVQHLKIYYNIIIISREEIECYGFSEP